MLGELFPLILQKENKYICITRPRRFGKTVMACMISSFFSHAYNTSGIFDHLKIAKSDDYSAMRNQFPVVHISMNDLPGRCSNYEQYLSRMEERLLHDLREAYPEADIHMDDVLWYAFSSIYEMDHANRFIFVLDEWDYIFHKDFVTGQAPDLTMRFYIMSKKRDEILSAMVVYGFLSYENGTVCIPNRELTGQLTKMLQKEPTPGYVYRLAKKSGWISKALHTPYQDVKHKLHCIISPLQNGKIFLYFQTPDADSFPDLSILYIHCFIHTVCLKSLSLIHI